ncbi:MAG: energy-coupling factor transporter ATPase [Negativicutes bacterium]|jgi:energy-coupling factor transport system ATP-binding protein
MSLVVKNIEFTYMKKTPFERKALRNVSLTINEGEFIGIIGHTGSGKSTLIQHLNGLLKADSGSVEVDNINIAEKSKAAKSARRKVGIVFQYPEQQLFEETVEKDIAYGPKNYGVDDAGVVRRVREAMDFVDLNYVKYANRSPFALSGGQMRRVAMAGILALKPEYLVLDEPTAGLDPRGRRAILEKISRLRQSTGCAVVMISHNMNEIVQYAERVIVMSKGEILLNDVAERVFANESVLRTVNMAPPETYQLLSRAREQGLQVEGNARTRIDCAKLLLAAYRREMC